MNKLYKKLEKYSLEDALMFENNDRQFIALQKLYDKNKNDSVYLALIICNSLICYQLSGKGEDYWEEFSNYFLNKDIKFQNIIEEMIEFIKKSKNNRRLLEIKINRLQNIKEFIENFEGKEEFYYKSMLELRNDLAKIMKQKKDAKTIVFAIKMFSYGARNIFDFQEYPMEIHIPIDSRLSKIFDKYKDHYNDIDKFYSDLSDKLNIPMLHLDGIIWNLYSKLIK